MNEEENIMKEATSQELEEIIGKRKNNKSPEKNGISENMQEIS